MDDYDDYEEEEYEPSEATMIWAAETEKQFKKEFPLKAETEKKRQQETFRRFAPREARKLNFDMTLSPEVPSELIAQKTLRETAERKLKQIKEENEQLKQRLADRDEKLATKSLELEKYTETVRELQDQKVRLEERCQSTLNDCNQSIENWSAFGKKYYTWFTIANTQLDVVKSYVEAQGKFDSAEEVADLNAGPAKMLRALEHFELDDETVSNLAVGSIQEYVGVEFPLLAPPELSRLTREAARADVSIGNFTMPLQSNLSVLQDESRVGEPEQEQEHHEPEEDVTILEDQTMMTDGCAANRSLIDYEKDEKIQRLLLENSVLKDRLNVSTGRAERSMIIEERNRTLQLEKNALQKKLDSTFTEIEAMRHGQARDLFKTNEKVASDADNDAAKRLQLIDRINQLVAKNNQLEKDFEAATSRMTKVMRDSSDCERRNERLEDAFSTERVKSQQLELEKKELVASIAELESRLQELQNELQNAAAKASDAPTAPATDAGNTTQILHMASNPFQTAHDEFQAAESRKRKAVEELEGETSGKRHLKDVEMLAELEERLELCEREKKVLEDSYTLHKELAAKFRQVCVALTGLQIKLRDADEGICTVQSEYEAGSATAGQFVFKYFFGTSRIDMLDVSCESSTQMLRKWEPLMKKYIGERNSIPAFLAAMQLEMESERDFDETIHERTHTFSVLHED